LSIVNLTTVTSARRFESFSKRRREMPTLDELDRRCLYLDEKNRFNSSLYHQFKVVVKPRAKNCGKVLWIVKDGKPVELGKEKIVK
jgi:hypothetical protein